MSSKSLLQSVGTTSQVTIQQENLGTLNSRSHRNPSFPLFRLFASGACLRFLFAVHLLMTIACIVVILYYNWELKGIQRNYAVCLNENLERTIQPKNATEEILFNFVQSVTSEICTKVPSIDDTFLTTIRSELKNLTLNLTEELIAHKCEKEDKDLLHLEADTDQRLSRNISLENISAIYNITFENILISSINETEELDLENILHSEYSKFCSVFYPHCRRSTQNETVVDCTLKMVGKPIMHVERLPTFGTYLLETWPTKNKRWSRKRWLMSNAISAILFEYDYEEYIGIKQPMKHYLDYLSAGTGAVVYNGSLYYHRHNSAFMVKYDLDSGRNVLRSIPNLAYRDCHWVTDDNNGNGQMINCAPENHEPYLYDIPHNFVDFAVDENGLFVVYRQKEKDFLTVAKIDGETMKVQRLWNVPDLNATDIANSFIICGVLYTIRNKTEKSTTVDNAYNLRTNELKQINISWSNPYKHLVMTDYNPFQEQIYLYDNGVVVSVALKIEYHFVNNTRG